ncbi:hypothetical protein PoB_006494900 [Plakobranchus ocellatus]|uniref:Secreted protein n=1 Tax=Plakobranchus ocellatus TaxID=259542 RepID=A0AAV4D2Q5_9GAST|nr:hypothetical protein PoB_006494900 [Plakobranchus ocellatus]
MALPVPNVAATAWPATPQRKRETEVIALLYVAWVISAIVRPASGQRQVSVRSASRPRQSASDNVRPVHRWRGLNPRQKGHCSYSEADSLSTVPLKPL